jgi:phosphoribosyl 1,2-cyclic phosphodiesterase
MEPLTIHFLGTGGGRHAMCTQKRRTAGIRLVQGKTQVHLDPGPGALVHSIYADLTPMRLNGVVVTHCHPDHYTDAEVLIEAMTGGTTRRSGVLAASRSVLEGGEGIDLSVSRYHQGLAGRVEWLEPGRRFEIGGLDFEAVEARHSDPLGVGLRVEAEVGKIGYTSDTTLFPELGIAYSGLRLLIICTMWPRGNPLKAHLCTDDALELIRTAKPRCTIITHFGLKMINAGPAAEAAYLEEKAGLPVVAAEDGMTATLGADIVFKGPRKRDEPRVVEA